MSCTLEQTKISEDHLGNRSYEVVCILTEGSCRQAREDKDCPRHRAPGEWRPQLKCFKCNADMSGDRQMYCEECEKEFRARMDKGEAEARARLEANPRRGRLRRDGEDWQ